MWYSKETIEWANIHVDEIRPTGSSIRLDRLVDVRVSPCGAPCTSAADSTPLPQTSARQQRGRQREAMEGGGAESVFPGFPPSASTQMEKTCVRAGGSVVDRSREKLSVVLQGMHTQYPGEKKNQPANKHASASRLFAFRPTYDMTFPFLPQFGRLLVVRLCRAVYLALFSHTTPPQQTYYRTKTSGKCCILHGSGRYTTFSPRYVDGLFRHKKKLEQEDASVPSATPCNLFTLSPSSSD